VDEHTHNTKGAPVYVFEVRNAELIESITQQAAEHRTGRNLPTMPG
jgi:hypothetical protein